jgi:hypothetical protein
MVVSKFDLAFIVALAVGLLIIEHGHRITISTLATAAASASSSICPVTDYAPFSVACIKYIEHGVSPAFQPHPRTPAGAVSTDAAGRADLHIPTCARSSANAPYSSNCIRMLSDDLDRRP